MGGKCLESTSYEASPEAITKLMPGMVVSMMYRVWASSSAEV